MRIKLMEWNDLPATRRALNVIAARLKARRRALWRRLDLPIPALIAKVIQLLGADPCDVIGHEAGPDAVKSPTATARPLCLWCNRGVCWNGEEWEIPEVPQLWREEGDRLVYRAPGSEVWEVAAVRDEVGAWVPVSGYGEALGHYLAGEAARRGDGPAARFYSEGARREAPGELARASDLWSGAGGEGAGAGNGGR